MTAIRFCVWPAVFLAAQVATADISVSVDKLDPSDGIPMPPPDLVVIDVAIDVSDADAFAGIGVHAVTSNGARVEYAYDPNGTVITSAPGAGSRFVTFFSRPRQRDADSRFESGAAVGTSGRYCGGAVSVFTDTQVNAVGLPLGYETSRDGYVLRIAMNLSQVSDPTFQLDSENIVVSTVRIPGALTLLETECTDFSDGVQVASRFGDNAYIGLGVYGIPEPATAVGLFLAGSVLLRRR